MKRKLYNLYQHVISIALVPPAYYLWLKRSDFSHHIAILILAIPILTQYVVPALGTNVTKCWKFTGKGMAGNFRITHGFVFGGITALIALFCCPELARPVEWIDVFRSSFLLGSVLALINWIYDIMILDMGVVTVYNRAWSKGHTSPHIAYEYAPAYFGLVGANYGAFIRIIEMNAYHLSIYSVLFWVIGFLAIALGIVLPVMIPSLVRLKKYGNLGWYPVEKEK